MYFRHFTVRMAFRNTYLEELDGILPYLDDFLRESSDEESDNDDGKFYFSRSFLVFAHF